MASFSSAESTGGLSTEALKQLMSAYRIQAGAHTTNKMRAEKLLKHLGYNDAKIEEILSKFKVRKQRAGAESGDEDDAEDGRTHELRSEAEMLAEILDKLTKQESEAKRQKQEAKSNQTEGKKTHDDKNKQDDETFDARKSNLS